jgi:hypothetical protein
VHTSCEGREEEITTGTKSGGGSAKRSGKGGGSVQYFHTDVLPYSIFFVQKRTFHYLKSYFEHILIEDE